VTFFDPYIPQGAVGHTFQQEVTQYGVEAGIATEPAAFCDGLKTWLTKVSQAVDTSFPDNTYAEIQNDRLMLRKTPRSLQADGLQCCFAFKTAPGGVRLISWTDLRH